MSSQSITIHSKETDSTKAGQSIGSQITKFFGGKSPDAVIVFASSRHNYTSLLASIHQSAKPGAMIGCSSAGEFTQDGLSEGSVSVVAIKSDEIQFAPAIGRGISSNYKQAAEELVSHFKGVKAFREMHKNALVLTDALAGYAESFVDQLNLFSGGTYQFFGGGAGDDAQFRKTHVFYGTEALSDAVVALEILSAKPLGIGVQHGWSPASPSMRVTEANGKSLISLNAVIAMDVFKDYAEETNQKLDALNPMPFFLNNIIGISSPGGYKLRVPLGVGPDGSIICAAEIPEGSMVSIMKANKSPKEAVSEAVTNAIAQLEGGKPNLAIFFDCVATRLRSGTEFEIELGELKSLMGSAQYAGCNTYGQISRSKGQFNGFHNCTAVVCVLPE